MRRNCCVGLDVDAVGAVVEVEVVDVAGAHEGAEGGGDLAEGNADGLGLLAIDGDEQLRIVGGEGGVHAGEAGAWSAALTDDGVGNAVDIAEGVAAGVLQHELEAADGADALRWRGAQRRRRCRRERRRAWARRRRRWRGRVKFGPIFVRSSMGLSGAKMRPEFGELPPASEKPMTEKVPKTPSFLRTTRGDLVGEVGGVAERGARGRLHDDEEVGLIFLRDERGGDMVVHERGGGEAAEEEQQHDVADADDEGDGAGVDADEPTG